MTCTKYSENLMPIEGYYKLLGDFYRHRFGMFLAFGVALIPLWYYAFQLKEALLFFVASIIPLFLFGMDMWLKSHVAMPIAYKIMSLEQSDQGACEPSTDHEPFWLLYLSFGNHPSEKHYAIITAPPGMKRQKQFSRVYIRNGLIARVAAFGFAFLLHAVLGIWMFVFYS